VDRLNEDYLAPGIEAFMESQGLGIKEDPPMSPPRPSPKPAGPAIPPPPNYCGPDPFSNPPECNPELHFGN